MHCKSVDCKLQAFCLFPDTIQDDIMSSYCLATDLHVLHDNIYVIRCFNDLIQANDVWVHEEPQDFDLPPHCSQVAKACYLAATA